MSTTANPASGLRILVNYHRADTGHAAVRLYAELKDVFGADSIFMDVDTIRYGQNWREAIEEAVAASDVVVTIIGEGWASVTDRSGRRRVDNPADPLRLELELALARRVPVIPVFVQGAEMPAPDELPASIAELVYLRGIELRHNHWRTDVADLVEALKAVERERREREAAEAAARGQPATVQGAASAEPEPEARAQQEERDLFERAAAPPVAAGQPPGLGLPAPELKPRIRWRRRWLSPRVRQNETSGQVLGESEDVRILFAASGDRVRRHASANSDSLGAVPLDTVDCTVFAPRAVCPGDVVLVQVFAHLPVDAEEARRIAEEFDEESSRRGFKGLEAEIARGTALTFDLRILGAAVRDPVQQVIWNGRPESAGFEVEIPSDVSLRTLVGTVTVSQNTVPVGHIKFKVTVTDSEATVVPRVPVGDDARYYKFAFVSYAAKDRDKVLQRVQMLRAARIECFQDLLDLDPGERWERKLYANIDRSDVFFLFWSRHARASTWVRKEVAYALARRGDDEFAPPEIRPVIIEGPPVVPPWAELAHLHFDDRVLYFMSGDPGRGG